MPATIQGRRSKAVACASCRRSKTRCEVLNPASARCHRCEVLGVSCSYEVNPPSPGETATPATPAAPLVSTGSPPSSTSSPDSSSSSRQTSLPPVTTPNGVSYWTSPPLMAVRLETTRSQSLWSFIPQALDWSAPTVAVQTLLQQAAINETPPPLPNDQSLHDVLSPAEIEHLIAIFISSYTPWINFIPLRGPFIDLVCCCIAVRHISPSPRLVKLTEEKVARMVFNPLMFESIETIQALIILSLWQGDGKVLISMAVSIAVNMQLNESSKHVARLKAEGQLGPELDEHMDRARLWIMLANVETLLCAGSHRKPTSSRSELDLTLIPYFTPSDPAEGRDARIRLLAELFNATSQGINIKPVAHTEIEQAHTGINSSLDDLEGLLRVMLPLSVISDHDRFHYHMLQCIVLGCRQLVLHRGFFLMRCAFGDRDLSNFKLWFLELKVHGNSISVNWGLDTVRTAEALLTTFLHCDSSTLLSTCPDIVFVSLAFAGSLVIAMRLFVQDRMGLDLRGPGEKLLERTAAVLERIALDENHSAMRCAKVIKMMLKIWIEQKAGGGAPSSANMVPSYAMGDFPGYLFNDDDFWSNLLGSTMSTDMPT
ncbi:hypothetical protein BDZ89DRAFT_754424 [Hymenopellis radicata]|nr:hypothetical protein BDZ89DRAFT_754424 [Hymenopellis radicata]